MEDAGDKGSLLSQSTFDSGAASNLFCEPDSGQAVTLVAFGGIKGELGVPPFEFFNITRNMNVRRIFVRDLSQKFYHGSMRPLGETIPQVADSLRPLLGDAPTIFVGNSAGGFAALAFGSLLKASSVLVFSPVVRLDRGWRFRHLDARWSAQISGINRGPGAQREFLRLDEFLRSTPPCGRCLVYYPAHSRLDRLHSEMLRDTRNLSLVPLREREHSITAKLRDSGRLERILLDSVREATASRSG